MKIGSVVNMLIPCRSFASFTEIFIRFFVEQLLSNRESSARVNRTSRLKRDAC